MLKGMERTMQKFLLKSHGEHRGERVGDRVAADLNKRLEDRDCGTVEIIATRETW
jgi:hypothetical protein